LDRVWAYNKSLLNKNLNYFFRGKRGNITHEDDDSVKEYSSVRDSSGMDSPWAIRLSMYNSIASSAIDIA